MDTTIHTSIFGKFVKAHDDKSYPINNTIKSIMFNNIDYIYSLNKSNKAKPTILENVERTIPCGSVFLGYNLFECPNCNKSFFEHNPFSHMNMKISVMTVSNVLEDLKHVGETFKSVAQRYG